MTGSFTLLSWNDLKDWQKDNEYILGSYIPAKTPVIPTLTVFHNETVNIYTHLIPALLSSLLLFALPSHVAFLVGVATCLGCSAAFHTIKSYSPHHARIGNSLDYIGIVFLITTSILSLQHVALNGVVSELRNSLVVCTLSLAFLCVVVVVRPRFRTPQWRPYRAMLFVIFGLSGAIPVAISYWNYGLGETTKRFALWWLLAEAGLYILGAAIYAARIPECIWPGKFDLIGHSHQIFHVMVVLAALCHGRCLYEANMYSFVLINHSE